MSPKSGHIMKVECPIKKVVDSRSKIALAWSRLTVVM